MQSLKIIEAAFCSLPEIGATRERPARLFIGMQLEDREKITKGQPSILIDERDDYRARVARGTSALMNKEYIVEFRHCTSNDLTALINKAMRALRQVVINGVDYGHRMTHYELMDSPPYYDDLEVFAKQLRVTMWK